MYPLSDVGQVSDLDSVKTRIVFHTLNKVKLSMIKKRSIRYIYVYINSDIVARVWSTSYVRGSMHVHGYIGPTDSDTQTLGARTEVTEQLKCSYLCVHNLWVSYWFR